MSKSRLARCLIAASLLISSPLMAQAMPLTDTLARAMADMAMLHAMNQHKVYLLLTPEQRRRLDQHAADHGMTQGEKPVAQ